MKSLLVIAALVCVATAATYPPLVLTGVRDSGISTLSTAYQQAVQEVNAAVEAFKPINATCTENYNLAVNSCSTCVKEKCTARAQQACPQARPAGWQIALGSAIGIITEDIPNVFTETIPDVFVNKIGGGVIDITKEAGNFFENTIGGGIVDLGNTIGNGVVNVGEDVVDEIVNVGESAIDGIVDVGEGFVDGVVDVGNAIEGVAVDGIDAITDGVNTAVDELENFGNTLGNVFGIGKRSIRLRKRRETEPGCSEFQSNATVACQFYLKPDYCSSCAFNSETDCPGYTDALNQIREVNAANSWLSKVTSSQYIINEMSYEFQNYDPATGGFSQVMVKANLFGKDLEITVDEPITPFDPDSSGPVVARYALEAFKET